jgi:NitT/TauT family transport system substrate-binding protein/sulfonate transport system substrate-binding protein
MRKGLFAGTLILGALFVLTCFGPSMAADKLYKFNTAWEPENETFITWYARQKGWDKEEGLDFNCFTSIWGWECWKPCLPGNG